jgi:hypothetical protein
MNEQFLKDMASLTLKYPQYTFIAPMIQDYQLLKYMPSVEATWKVWGDHCRLLIERSNMVWVMMYDGWRQSVGVKGEIEHADRHNVPVRFVDTTSLEI